MQLQREDTESHTITHYTESSVVIQEKPYNYPLIVNREIIKPWSVKFMRDLIPENFSAILELKPQVVILGHKEDIFPPIEISLLLAKQQIGLESMSIAAACRTFNLLLSEGREVVLALIL